MGIIPTGSSVLASHVFQGQQAACDEAIDARDLLRCWSGPYKYGCREMACSRPQAFLASAVAMALQCFVCILTSANRIRRDRK